CWGFENREAAIRVPSVYWGQEMATTNIEIKCVDNSSNPYLALACIIACGLDGVKRQLPLPPQVETDPSTLTADEMAAACVQRLPASLHEALIEMEQDEYLMKVLGEEFASTYITVKTSECGAFAGANSEFELSQHRNKF
ncbi:MAG: hypothetical protein ACRD3W_27890, partial [Terriglobales bacterium]